MVPVLVAAAPAYAEWHGNAHIETVEVTGSYLTDDISEAGLKKAREEAHKDALRLATEKAGVFVQSYSKTHNQVLTEDEIQSISGNILAVQNESYEMSKTNDGYTLVTCHLTAYIQLDQVDLNQAIQQINIEGENRELKAVIEGLKHSQGKAGELPYGTAYFQKFAQNSSLLKKVCDVGYDVDSVSYDKATGLIRYNRFTRAVDDDQLYAFHVELSYPDNTERIYKITKITEKPFQTVELKFKNARTTMLPIATYSTDDYYRRLVCKQLQLPEYAHLKQPGWGPIPLLDPPLYTDKLNMKRIDGMLYCSTARWPIPRTASPTCSSRVSPSATTHSAKSSKRPISSTPTAGSPPERNISPPSPTLTSSTTTEIWKTLDALPFTINISRLQIWKPAKTTSLLKGKFFTEKSLTHTHLSRTLHLIP